MRHCSGICVIFLVLGLSNAFQSRRIHFAKLDVISPTKLWVHRVDAKQNARYMAIASLAQTKKSFAVRTLESQWKELDPRDKAFARLLVATAERHHGQIDHVIGKVAQRWPKSRRVLATLKIGVVQLLWLKTPPHAAIKETVETLRVVENNQSATP